MKTQTSQMLVITLASLVLVAGVVMITLGAFWIADSSTSEGVLVSFDAEYLQVKYTDASTDNTLAVLNVGRSDDGRSKSSHILAEVKNECDFEDNENVITYSTSDSENKVTCRTLTYTNENGEVGALSFQINQVKNEKDFNCFETLWVTNTNWLSPTDCIVMASYEDFWFGSAEMYYQWWPINRKCTPKYADPRYYVCYMSDFRRVLEKRYHCSRLTCGDMYADDQQYGSVLDRYWLSSNGVGVFVEADVPLHASTENGQICLKGSYQDYPHTENFQQHWLKYTTCFSPDARKTHSEILKNKLHFERPTGLPDLRMIKSPIWSTWARYKVDINQSTVLDFAKEINENGFSNSQIEVDDGYESNYGDYTFDPDKFPDAAGMIQELHDMGFRVTTWVTPFINPRSDNYKEANDSSYFVINGNTKASGTVRWWNGIGSMLDFTNEKSCDWYVEKLDSVRDHYGVDSFKFDAGEINYLTAISNFQTHDAISNLGYFTKEYAKCANRLGDQIELRSAWRSQDLPVFVRMMDKDSNWTPAKGLQTLIPTALTFSILGYPYILPDMIGGNGYESGFHGKYIPEKELYIRWLEITAFMPNMQFSITPWQYDSEVNEIAKKYVDIHEGVIYDEIVRSSNDLVNGEAEIGPIRPIWWIAPKDDNAFHISDQFLVGDKYLVAPIVNNGTSTRNIYLPGPLDNKGRDLYWRDKLNDGEIWKGGVTLYNFKIEIDEISWWEVTYN